MSARFRGYGITLKQSCVGRRLFAKLGAGAILTLATVALAERKSTTSDSTAFSVSAIEVDGAKIALDTNLGKPLSIPAQSRSVDFVFKPNDTLSTATGSQMPRFRYKLEGFDRQWLDPIGVMRFAVRFNDAADNTISGEEFDAHGESKGWCTDLSRATLLARRETLDVPKGAARLQVWLSSAGPHQTMGVYAICDLVARLIPRDSSDTERSVALIPGEGSMMELSSGTPSGWARHGTSLGIAQIAPRAGRTPLIVMRDDRPDAFGGWLVTSTHAVNLTGVAKIVLEWQEAYSIGWGGSAKVSYRYLPPGNYQMRVQAVSIEGAEAGRESSRAFTVVPPFFETRWFWGGLSLFCAASIAWAVRTFTRRRMQRRLDALERANAIERERGRIARDLHDNLGADLTHMALLSELARVDVGNPAKTAEHFDRIFDTAQSLTRKVDEIVWAVNPANDSLRGFIPFLTNHTQSYLHAAGISCRLALPSSLPDAPLSSPQRHHLFLVVKESLQNVLKHAKATEVWLRLDFHSGVLRIQIADNGRGCDESAAPGDGTLNMQKRMADLGGSVCRESAVEKGTCITLSLPLKSEMRTQSRV